MTVARIKTIAAATTLSLAALIGLQGYWLWRGYRDARAAHERQVDVVLGAIRERIDPGDEIAEQIAVMVQGNDTVHSRAVLGALRSRVDLDLTRAPLPHRYTIILERSDETSKVWIDPPSSDTTGARMIQLRSVCSSCDVRLGLSFDDIGPRTFLASIAGFVAISVTLVSVLVACVVATFVGLARLRRRHEQHVAFVNNLAHEFRTPLFSISVAGKVLDHADVVRSDAELSRQVALIGRAKERLSKHTERLLDLAALQSENARVNLAPVDLNALVRRAAGGLEPLRESVGATVRLDLNTQPVIVHGDVERLEQAVTNLIDNALKYGGAPAHVVVRTKRDGDRCSIEVEDSGAGVERRYRTEIFTPFFRIGNGSQQHDVKGFGLGLSQVLATADIHRGRIEVRDAQSPNGALFVLTLPAETAQ